MIISIIIGNVVRFSLIILRRSIFDEKSEVTKPSPQTSGNVQVATTSLHSSLPKSQTSAVLTFLKGRLKSYKFKWPNGYTKVPGLAAIMRLVIISMMGLLVLFPLASLLHYKEIETINKQKRDEYVVQFQKDAELSLLARTSLLKREIKLIEDDLAKNSSFYQEGGLAKEKKDALTRLNTLLNKEIQSHQNEQQEVLEHFMQEIEGKFFLSLTFKSVTRMPFFSICILLIGTLLLLSHLILFRLKSKIGNTYSKRSTDHYRYIIDHEYAKTTKEGYAYLKSKYNYEPMGYQKNVHWENPPYNTILHHPFSEKKRIDKDTFMKSFETQPQIEVEK
jgi:hypothetical protein